MKYETPQLTALTPAISAIQTAKSSGNPDSPPPETHDSASAAYEDYE